MRSLTVILGCLTVATTCPAQTPNWTQIKPSTSPPARSRHAMIYDSARQRTVLFGGLLTGGNVVLADTWEWNDGKWTKIKPAKSPSARLGHRMAYDSVRRRTVLFRGNNTWEWDGTNWTKMSPANSPSARDFVAMAYDSVRQRTVLFGGRNGSSNFTDTWEWDGINWTKMTPVNSPPSRWGSAMVYDSARQRTVLFGGGLPVLADTWEWNGRNWMKMTPTNSPPARFEHGMAYDSARRRTVIFGGYNKTRIWVGDTWEWDGADWRRITPIKSPSARDYVRLTYDSVRQRTVLFGGRVQSTGYSAETWEYGIPNLTLTANTPTISIATGGTQTLTLNAGTGLARKSYWIFGSATSTMPGVVLTGIHIPLVPDVYTNLLLGIVNSPTFRNFKGPLSAMGTATASITIPASLPIPTGIKLYHAYVVYDGTTGQTFTSSNPVSVEFK